MKLSDAAKLHDNSIMYFGKHKGKLLKDVPSSYLFWLESQDWMEQHLPLLEYIHKNWKSILRDMDNDREDSAYLGLDSFDDLE